MVIELKSVLDAETLRRVHERLASIPRVDGRTSAGLNAAPVKRNEEADPHSPGVDALNREVLLPLYRHSVFQSAVLPRRLSGAFFARYSPGMAYGQHVDDPIMGPEGSRYRSDVAITIFLNSASAYTGGELVIAGDFGNQSIKLDAGDAVIYPASSLHEVRPVESGERWVAVAWAESMVRDSRKRKILYDLGCAEDAIRDITPPEPAVLAKIQQSRANLLREWADV
jgi:PKHD-type hydroxylase